MLAISPQFSSTIGWLLEDPSSHHHQQNTNLCITTSKLTDNSDSSGTQAKNSQFPSFHCHQGLDDDRANQTMAKKLNHNASERDRRKRINSMYSTLRSLLPLEDQSRELSIPATVSRVLKYIPELQREVDRLVQKKENLMSNISRQEEGDSSMGSRKHGMIRKNAVQSSSSAVSATQISDREIVVQISIPKVGKKGSFSGALAHLEMEGFLVLCASCFEPCEGRVFCNLHLQAQRRQVKDAEMLKEKICSFFEKGEGIRLI